MSGQKHSKCNCFSRIGGAGILALIAMMLQIGRLRAQEIVDTSVVTPRGDVAEFWAQIPAGYSPLNPPAILIWWHQLPADQYEMVGNPFQAEANNRGWILASHAGPYDSVYSPHRHWNTARAQMHCRSMLDWIAARYPFHRDSIYMAGASMGGAGGQIWHNNNCGSEDYLIAATAGASQILDCQLRQEQYLAIHDTNRSMRQAFGGLPCERDSVAFEYHRASAIHVRDTCDADPAILDTSESMHYNSLHLPVWITWGADDLDRERYRGIALTWDSIRTALGADTTWIGESWACCHGAEVMGADSICQWLSGFSAKRYPDDISIAADENGDYYWTHVTLTHNDTLFGRYGASKSFEERRLDLTLVRNVQSLRVNFTFPWPQWDSLSGRWLNLDRSGPPNTIQLSGVPPVLAVHRGQTAIPFTYEDRTLTINHEFNDRYTVVFDPRDTDNRPSESVPTSTRLVAAYPNPSNSQFILQVESARALRTSIEIFDESGRLTKSLTVGLTAGLQRIPVPAAELPSGIYFAQLKDSRSRPFKIAIVR